MDAFLNGVILSGAALQAERRIWRGVAVLMVRARSLGPLVKARAFGMTPAERDEIQNRPTTRRMGRERHSAWADDSPARKERACWGPGGPPWVA